MPDLSKPFRVLVSPRDGGSVLVEAVWTGGGRVRASATFTVNRWITTLIAFNNLAGAIFEAMVEEGVVEPEEGA